MSNESLLTLLLFLNNQNISAAMAISPIEPSTPPTIGAGVSRGFDDIPAVADDSSGFAVFAEVTDVDTFDAAMV